MEPTNRRETGARPSALKRYGPWIAILVVIVVIGGVVLLTNSSDDSSNDKASDSTGSVKTSGGPAPRQHW